VSALRHVGRFFSRVCARYRRRYHSRVGSQNKGQSSVSEQPTFEHTTVFQITFASPINVLDFLKPLIRMVAPKSAYFTAATTNLRYG
jgi:hypothetical protein